VTVGEKYPSNCYLTKKHFVKPFFLLFTKYYHLFCNKGFRIFPDFGRGAPKAMLAGIVQFI